MNICKNKTICNCVLFLCTCFIVGISRGLYIIFMENLWYLEGIAGGFRGFWFRLWRVKESFDFRGLRGLDFDFRGVRGGQIKKNFLLASFVDFPQ